MSSQSKAVVTLHGTQWLSYCHRNGSAWLVWTSSRSQSQSFSLAVATRLARSHGGSRAVVVS